MTRSFWRRRSGIAFFQAVSPLLAVRDVNARVAIRIAVDAPFEAQIDQRRMFDEQFARRDDGVAGRGQEAFVDAGGAETESQR